MYRQAGLLCVASLLPCAAVHAEEEPFQHLVNLLYNERMVLREDMFPDSFSGPPQKKGTGGLPPGWIPKGKAAFSLNRKTFYTPPSSISIAAPRGDAAIESLAVPAGNAEFALARCRVHCTGPLPASGIALKWTLHDGSFTLSRSPPPQRENDFGEISLITKVPDHAVSVSLVLKCSAPAERALFDTPFLGLAGLDITIFTLPEGCHPNGVREAVIRTRLPLQKPFARVRYPATGAASPEKEKPGKTASAHVHPLQVHKSGFYYYAADLGRFQEPGRYQLTVFDAAVKDRNGTTSFTIRKAPYKRCAAGRFALLEKELTAETLKGRPLHDIAEHLVLLSYALRTRGMAGASFTKLPVLLVSRLDAAGAAPSAEENALCAWALASLGRSMTDKKLLERAEQLLLSTWEEKNRKQPLAICALAAAGSIVAAERKSVLARDIADDMVREIERLNEKRSKIPGVYTIEHEYWAVFALVEYMLSAPESNLIPFLRRMIEGFYALQDRLHDRTPFGQPKALLENNLAVEIPSWNEGNTLYVLSTACALLSALQAVPDHRFVFHAERHLHFVSGYNELGYNLIENKQNRIFSLRSEGPDGSWHPGRRRLAVCPAPLKAQIYLAWAAAGLHVQLKRQE